MGVDNVISHRKKIRTYQNPSLSLALLHFHQPLMYMDTRSGGATQPFSFLLTSQFLKERICSLKNNFSPFKRLHSEKATSSREAKAL